MLAFAKIIADDGGRYTQKATDCDFYISDEIGQETACTRCSGIGNAKIFTTVEFLVKIGITQSELDAIPFPSDSEFKTHEVGWWESTEKRRKYAAELAERESRNVSRQNNKLK